MEDNMSSGVKYAGFWRRFVGWLIDILIIIVASHWVNVALAPLIKLPVPESFEPGAIVASFAPYFLINFLVSFVITALYYCLFEASALQATLGKCAVGIRVTDFSGQKISYGRALLRRICSILSAIPFMIGYIAAAFTKRKQTFHDLLSKTVVVVYRPRKAWVLIVVAILTAVVGGLCDKYLGAGFNFSIRTPTSTLDVRDGRKELATKNINEIDPALLDSIVKAVLKKKSVFASNNPTEIRKYLIAWEDGGITEASKDDQYVQRYGPLISKILENVTEESMLAPSTIWTFTTDMKDVQIKIETSQTSSKTLTTSVIMKNVNGEWY